MSDQIAEQNKTTTESSEAPKQKSPYLEMAKDLDQLTQITDGKGDMLRMRFDKDFQPTVMVLPLLDGRFDGTNIVAFDVKQEEAPNYLAFTPDGIVAINSRFSKIDNKDNSFNVALGDDHFSKLSDWIQKAKDGDTTEMQYDSRGMANTDSLVKLTKVDQTNVLGNTIAQKAVQSLVALNIDQRQRPLPDIKLAVEAAGGIESFETKCNEMKSKFNDVVVKHLNK